MQASLAAVVADGLAVFLGFMLGVWIRFDSGWFPVPLGAPANRYAIYGAGALVAAIVFLLIFRSLGLYIRPQVGAFSDKMPRLVRASALGILLSTALAFLVKNTLFSFSSGVLLLAFFTVLVLVLAERFLLFRAEIQFARLTPPSHRVLIVGTGPMAAHLRKVIDAEPRLRSTVAGFLRTAPAEEPTDVPPESIRGAAEDLGAVLDADGQIRQVVLADSSLEHARTVNLLLLCERHLVDFKLVPDMFRILTGTVHMEMVGDVPMIGVGPWPLDRFWNRVVKRLEDIAGAVVGCILSAPAIAVAAVAIRRGSPGPVFYRQERCGERGKVFVLYKLRTMPVDAESATGPVWTRPDDPRRTRVGTILRRCNLDELPQFWNVLKGDMSLVGPRPERPHFVEHFREDVARYMSRHASKPGLTGWAQVNGLRGSTSIEERVKYDLYYLENWSLAFDFKILARTVFARKNAY